MSIYLHKLSNFLVFIITFNEKLIENLDTIKIPLIYKFVTG